MLRPLLCKTGIRVHILCDCMTINEKIYNRYYFGIISYSIFNDVNDMQICGSWDFLVVVFRYYQESENPNTQM